MVIRKDDFTPYAINLGIWDRLLEEAGIGSESEIAETAEIEIVKAKIAQ